MLPKSHPLKKKRRGLPLPSKQHSQLVLFTSSYQTDTNQQNLCKTNVKRRRQVTLRTQHDDEVEDHAPVAMFSVLQQPCLTLDFVWLAPCQKGKR
jgi:hypothetical protein